MCSVNEKLGANYKTKAIQDLYEEMKQNLRHLSSNSRTSALWATYHDMITLVKYFIRAESMHDFEMQCIYPLQQECCRLIPTKAEIAPKAILNLIYCN